MKPEEVSFGIKPPCEVSCYWGARAIYSGGTLDIPYDRRTVSGLIDYSMQRFVKACMREINLNPPDPSSNHLIDLRRDGYVFQASCKGSYGYMYLGCWPEPSVADKVSHLSEGVSGAEE